MESKADKSELNSLRALMNKGDGLDDLKNKFNQIDATVAQHSNDITNIRGFMDALQKQMQKVVNS
jgi:hypothetical protein